jgi:transcriptional regulator
MYLPAHFEQTDHAALHALVRAHPLATLVVVTDDGPTADRIPLRLADDARTLQGHVARANPLWQHADGATVLAVFDGPAAYVSPSWYPSKRAHGKVVPTWNYTTVQARGRLRAVHDAAWVHTLVSRLTDQQEAPRVAPWGVDDAPPDYVQQMLRAIVGIEIAIESLRGKWKVSQNRDAADRAGVAAGLGDDAMAALVAAAGR